MTKHPVCIPKTVTGILAWGHNFNTGAPNLDQKYKITETLGENVLVDCKSRFDQWVELQSTRQNFREYSSYLTDLSLKALEGPMQDIIVMSAANLSPSPGQYRIMGGVLPGYSVVIDYLLGPAQIEHADALALGLIHSKPTSEENLAQSHVTLHRSESVTTINCTKPGGADCIGVEYDHSDGTGWHSLHPGIGTNAQWKDEFRSPERPVTLVYRIRLYKRGHEIGVSTIASISSQPKNI